jgi:hypothetical protein
MAFFSDPEEFANNQLVAGELDLKVSWEEHYSDWLGEEQTVDGVRMVETTADLAANEVGLPSYDNPMLAVRADDTDGNGVSQIEEFMDATLQEQFPDEATREQLAQLPPEVDPCEALADVPDDLDGPVLSLDDVKPGDFGEVTFDFTLCDNPGYVWLNGGLVSAAENGLTEPEQKDDDEVDGIVELLDEIQVTVWYDDGDNILEESETYVTERSVVDGNPASSAVALTGDQRIIARGTLREVLDALSTGRGIPLDGIPNDDSRDCFAPTPTIHYVGVSWALPVDHANEIQGDSVTFDLGFYTEQCRHNDGLPQQSVGQSVDLSTGSANWQVTAPDGTTGPVQTMAPNDAWATSACASWVDADGTDGQDPVDAVGTYTFELDFEVANAPSSASLEIPEFGADNSVELLLDGTSLVDIDTSAFGSLRGPISQPIAPGEHTLTAVVENFPGNGPNPMGLLLCGRVEY